MTPVAGPSRDELFRAAFERCADRLDLIDASDEPWAVCRDRRTAAVVELIATYQRWPLLAVEDDLAQLAATLADSARRRTLRLRLLAALEQVDAEERRQVDDVIEGALQLLRETSHLVVPREVLRAA